MAMPKYRIITSVDQAAAERWISRHLPELPCQAGKKYRIYSSALLTTEILNSFIDHWLDSTQRRRLHSSIRQSRMRQAKRKKNLGEVTITFSGETVTRLNDLVDWHPILGISRTRYLEWLIKREWDQSPLGREENMRKWEVKRAIEVVAQGNKWKRKNKNDTLAPDLKPPESDSRQSSRD